MTKRIDRQLSDAFLLAMSESEVAGESESMAETLRKILALLQPGTRQAAMHALARYDKGERLRDPLPESPSEPEDR